MRFSSALIAFGLAVLLPSVPAAFGADMPAEQYAALAVVGFSIGLILAGLLDIATYNDREEAESLRRQREALTWATEVSNQEREARLRAVAPVETPPDTSHDWYNAVETFLMAGDVGGFSIRRMQGVVGSDVWAQLTTLLADAGWLANVPGRGYQWADGYTLARAITELRADRLPYPTGPAPVVIPPVHNRTQRNAPRQRSEPPPRIVEHAPAE